MENLNACEYEVATAEADSIKFYCCEVGTTQTIILRVYQLNASGNPATGADGMPIFHSCLVIVEIQEKIRPACIPPADVTVSCQTFDPDLETYGIPDVYDNCCLNESYDYGGQCGLSHTANYNLFDAACNTGMITRTFRVYDCQGQSSQCTQRIAVADEQAPNVLCINGLVVSITPAGTFTLYATDPLLYSQDNCTPANLLQYGIRKIGEGTGFPVDAAGNPITSVDFDCTDLGAQQIQLWVRDCAGKANYCQTLVYVYDLNDFCSPGMRAGAKAPNLNSNLRGRLELALYPNPANNEVNIQLHEGGSGGLLTIYNQLGSVLWEHTVEAGASALNVSLGSNLFSPGIYLISLRSNNGVITRRLIVSK